MRWNKSPSRRSDGYRSSPEGFVLKQIKKKSLGSGPVHLRGNGHRAAQTREADIGGDLVDANTDAIDRMLNLKVNVVMKNVHDVLPHMIGRVISALPNSDRM
jgi:hypothetical protein